MGLLALALLGLAGLAAVDKLLRRPEAPLIALFVGLEAFSIVGNAVATFRGVEQGTQIGVLGPLATGVSLLVAVFVIARPAPRPAGRIVWLAAVGFVGVSLLASALAGSGLPQTFLEMLVVLTAIYLAPRLDVELATAVLKMAIGAILVASLAALLLGAPGAAEPYGAGWIPALDMRVNGITRHANVLGPLAVVYGLVEHVRPSRRGVRAVMLTTSGLLLLLSQSKTAWVVAAFSVAVIALGHEARRRKLTALAALGVVAAATLLLVGGSVEDLLPADEAEKVSTLTGRTTVWADGLERWADSDPLVGGGSGLFHEYARRTGQEWAGQAHNQFIQTVAEHGLLGLVALLVYVAVLLRVAWRLGPTTGYVSVALVGGLLLRSLTETPVDQLDLQHVSVYMMLLAWCRGQAAVPGGLIGEGSERPAAAGAGTGSRSTPATSGPRAVV